MQRMPDASRYVTAPFSPSLSLSSSFSLTSSSSALEIVGVEKYKKNQKTTHNAHRSDATNFATRRRPRFLLFVAKLAARLYLLSESRTARVVRRHEKSRFVERSQSIVEPQTHTDLRSEIALSTVVEE